jgi:galactokinase
MREIVEEKFKEIFGTEGRIKIYFAPGRVNLIGEHTDYNGGHVFPCALTLGTYAAVRKREDRNVNLYSTNFEKTGIATISLDNLKPTENEGWTKYVKGAIWAVMEQIGDIEHGFDIVYGGNLPIGTGLSSSSCIEVLTLYIIKDMFKLKLDATQIALMAQKAEIEYVGINCGIMDQFIISKGKENSAMFLDTATLEYEYVPINLEKARIVILNTRKKRVLEDSKYNVRRAECEKALDIFKKNGIQINTLGDMTKEQFEENKELIEDEIIRKRAKHAVYENQRTIEAVTALKENNLEKFGELMCESHKSLKEDYEVTGYELDTIVDAAMQQEGVYGARMTGAGFGGCAIALVKKSKMDAFIQNVKKIYKENSEYYADVYMVEIGNGPQVL